jgi:hypothetical protein
MRDEQIQVNYNILSFRLALAGFAVYVFITRVGANFAESFCRFCEHKRSLITAVTMYTTRRVLEQILAAYFETE